VQLWSLYYEFDYVSVFDNLQDTSTLAVVIATFVGLAITFLLLKDSKKLVNRMVTYLS